MNKSYSTLFFGAAALLFSLQTSAQKSVPWTETFDTEDTFGEFISIDGDGNGNAWKYISWNQDVHSSFNADRQVSDWLLTPEITLCADRSYKLDFDAFCCIANTPERLEVLIGEGNDTSAFTSVLIPPTIINKEKAQAQQLSAVISVPTAGTYRIAFHAISDKDSYWVGLDNMSLKENALNSAPAAVTNLSATADGKGLLKASISFNAPAVDANGNSLQTLSKIELLRDNALLPNLTLESPTPGAAYTVVDSTPTTGTHYYKVLPYNANGAGLADSVSVFVGQGIPQSPTDAHIKDEYSQAVLSWKAPSAEGTDGRYVRTQELQYNIYDPWGNKVATVTDGITSWTLPQEVYNNSDQTYHWYIVKAQTPAGESILGDSSSYVVTGTAYTLPFRESWKEGHSDDYHLWWSPVDPVDRWNDGFGISTVSVDEGYGYSWNGYKAGAKTELGSGKFTLLGTTNPHLFFSYYAHPGSGLKLTVMADEGTEESVSLGEIDFSTLSGEEGWRTADYNLKALTNSKYFVLRICAEASQSGCGTVIDRVVLRDVKGVDVSAIAISAPEKARIGEPIEVSTRIWNIGSGATDATASLYVNGRMVESKVLTGVEADTETPASFSYTPLVTDEEMTKVYVKATAEGDEDSNNDCTDTLTIHLDQPDYPYITDLAATSIPGDGATLSWTAPAIDNSAKTDDFESYAPWLRENVGKWTIVDGDRAYTYGLNGYEFPNAGDRIGFMVWNPSDASIEANEYNGLQPHSGSQSMASFSLRDNSESVDDWLISPLLSEEEQAISFWAKSQSALLPESFRVRYSSTNTDTASFTGLAEQVDAASEDWTKYEYVLPAGTRYFAIQSIGAHNYMLQIDDVTFRRALLVRSGYRVYRDGVLIDSLHGDATTYHDRNVSDGTHTYQLTVIYTLGESQLSNEASTTTDISSVSSSPSPADAARKGIYSIDGKRISTSSSLQDLPEGVYIIDGKKIAK